MKDQESIKGKVLRVVRNEQPNNKDGLPPSAIAYAAKLEVGEVSDILRALQGEGLVHRPDPKLAFYVASESQPNAMSAREVSRPETMDEPAVIDKSVALDKPKPEEENDTSGSADEGWLRIQLLKSYKEKLQDIKTPEELEELVARFKGNVAKALRSKGIELFGNYERYRTYLRGRGKIKIIEPKRKPIKRGKKIASDSAQVPATLDAPPTLEFSGRLLESTKKLHECIEWFRALVRDGTSAGVFNPKEFVNSLREIEANAVLLEYLKRGGHSVALDEAREIMPLVERYLPRP